MSHLSRFIHAADQLVKYTASFREIPAAKHTVPMLSARKLELSELWAEVKAQYALCLRERRDDDKEIDPETLEEKYSSSNETYLVCLGLILELEDKLRQEYEQVSQSVIGAASASPSSKETRKVPNETPPEHKSHGIKLPVCETETFRGNYLTWPTFRDIFEAVYIRHPHLSEVEKLFHLRSKTDGDAFSIVEKFPLTHSSFKLAWEALRSTYENKRIIVNNQIKTLFNLPTCSSESSKSIKNLQRQINDCIAALKAHDVNVTGWDPILVYACSNHLPPNTLSLWEQSLSDHTSLPSWVTMDQFLSTRFQVLETIADVTASPASSSNSRTRFSKSTSQQKNRLSTFHAQTQNSSCKICSGQHNIMKCPKFLSLKPLKRFELVRQNRLCVNCRFTCSTCNKTHHTLLHFNDSFTKPVSNAASQNLTSERNPWRPASENHSLQSTAPAFVPQTAGHTHFVSSQRRVLLATALVKIIGKESNHCVRALIDPGSEVSFIVESVQKRLQLPTIPINIAISSVNSTHAASSNKCCSLSLANSENPSAPIVAQAIVLKKITNHLPSISFSQIDPTHFNGLNLADPSFNSSAQIDLLIGADLYPVIVRQGLRTLCETLVAQNTVFGWVLSGPLPQTVNTFSTFVSNPNKESLDDQLKRFWELEEVQGKKPILSIEDQFCENLYERTTYRQPDGRYVVRLPFKDEVSSKQLGFSRNIVLSQFLRTERNLTKNPELQTQYSKVISEYLTLGHMRKVESTEEERNGKISSFYLPHHAVLKPESTSTKVRVVFNGSSASTSGVSLNDLLYTGPVLQRDLTSLIIKWRFYAFVFNADIEKMYRQILIHPDDTSYQRILFRFPGSPLIQDLELLTVTFGVNCAPYLAIRTLLQLAKDNQVDFPLASRILGTECYVDDVLSGAHDLLTAKRAQSELIRLLQSAGFPLRKWTSNTPSLLNHLSPDHVLSEHFLKLDKESNTKTLGIRWNASEDYFYFTVPSFRLSKAPSKREVFSQIAQLFDPAGWLAPIVINAKILMQRIWVEATDWDTAVETETFSKWKSFVESLVEIQQIKIPRWVEFSPAYHLEIHGFCDSSEKAYAAALYVRIVKSDGFIRSHLICAKSKVAPIKTVSLPRLELCGAVLLSRLVTAHSTTFPVIHPQTYLWTDSSIVLAWLNKHPSTWKTFVANRTSEIIDNVTNKVWRHVKSGENPADLATRGLSPCDLAVNPLWWNGPCWLREPQEHWPTSCPVSPPSDQLEHKVNSCHVQLSSYEDILARFSSLSRALRVLSYIFRFYHRILPQRAHQIKYETVKVSQEEINFTKNRLILLSQQVHFYREHESLSKNQLLSPKSSIITLNPYLDSNKLLRVNGRLVNSELSSNEKHPIILPYESTFAKLFIDFVHELTLHGGNALMISVVRRMFWIPKLKNMVKFCIRRCKICVIHRKQLRTQIMAALPVERCTFSPPFTYTGVDFAGPFLIKSYRGRGCRITKGYACLFVCFATKAVHLEAASDLTSYVFLELFARFVARRGLPKEMYSDHGTNFMGANTLLQRDFKKFLASASDELRSKYAIQGFEWKFIPPGAPHMGGLWEAGIKSLKNHLRKLGDTNKFTFEEFSTILARIEACLNSRPISPMSNDPLDPLALTPAHFLRGCSLLAFPEPNCNEKRLSLINRYEKLKLIQQEFCHRWKTEYLNELHKRFKWQFPKENVKINDLVVIKQENLPSTEWRLGRVTKVCTGPDGKVRVAAIKTEQGEITRPIVKLCVLPNA